MVPLVSFHGDFLHTFFTCFVTFASKPIQNLSMPMPLYICVFASHTTSPLLFIPAIHFSHCLLLLNIEYLYLPAVRTQYASEFGHLIRVLSIYAKMEFALDALNGKFDSF